jgi:hypothetical protein
MYAQSARVEAGYVVLPRAAPWLDEFRSEILQFPRGRYDDQIDSLSQYLGWMATRPMPDAPTMVVKSQFAQAAAAELPDLGSPLWSLSDLGEY